MNFPVFRQKSKLNFLKISVILSPRTVSVTQRFFEITFIMLAVVCLTSRIEAHDAELHFKRREI